MSFREQKGLPWDRPSQCSITVFAPHQVLTLLEQKGGSWLKTGLMGIYQAILLENPNATLQTPNVAL